MGQTFAERHLPTFLRLFGYQATEPIEPIVEPPKEVIPELEQLVGTPERIDTGAVIQVRPEFVYESMFFEVYVAFPTAEHPLVHDAQQQKYIGVDVPWTSFRFSDNYNEPHSLNLPHSCVFARGYMGVEGYLAHRVTVFPGEGDAEMATDRYHKVHIFREGNPSTSIVQALADNRLQPPAWKQNKSAFLIGDKDKGILAEYIAKHLEPILK
ncbi:hypothetical protein HYX12_04555 [Candidatus Woesearchaeota archaeon]|nr:hypothetical protein [Candidatus Woesearchaeota archaeon]